MSTDEFDRWRDTTLKSVEDRFGTRRETFTTSDSKPVENLYGPWSEGAQPEQSFPGEFPFTRGVQPTMYRGRFWTMRQYAGFGSATQSNERYRYLLEQGTTGLSVAFDLPTQMGFDSDSDRAHGEVGKVGVAIDSIADMEILFDQIPLDKVSTSMTINSTAGILLALYIAVAQGQGVDVKKLRGTIQNDLLKEYIARGTYIFPPRQSMRLITDIFGFCAEEVPTWNTVSISGYHIREAGSTATQEVAFTLANGIAYVESAIKAGLDVDAFAPRLSFFFNAHNNLIEEVAKFRAARKLWATTMKERFGAKHPKSMQLRFHTQTAGSTLTAQQPQANIARVTLQALASVLGGTQSLHTNSWDEALSLPSQDAATLALRTQQVIAHESGVADFVDVLAGSYAVESMTERIYQDAAAYIARIDEQGGAVAAIENGFQQSEIQDAAYHAQLAIESQAQIIVGVNQFQVEESAPEGLLRVDDQVETDQIQRLREFKASRSDEDVRLARRGLENAARTSDNLMPHILRAVKKKVTLGEISNTLRNVFGEHVENVVI